MFAIFVFFFLFTSSSPSSFLNADTCAPNSRCRHTTKRLALNGALLEWGHTTEALKYLGFFFGNYVCMATWCVEPLIHQYGRTFGGNASFGGIIYNVFGCDSDADYGRLIDLYVQAVRYSGNMTWAAAALPAVHALATNVLVRRAEAVAMFPVGHPFHGMVYGSAEHDICTAPSIYFSINVWFARGLLSLGQMHSEFPALSTNATFESMLLPTAAAWRSDINFAANYTAVKRDDGNGLFFLHPVVGSAYSESDPPFGVNLPPTALNPVEGGDESTCIRRGTCFTSMTAGVPGAAAGGSNQNTNYANFRIFSETLLAGILEPQYELAIMNYRESHRGTRTCERMQLRALFSCRSYSFPPPRLSLSRISISRMLLTQEY